MFDQVWCLRSKNPRPDAVLHVLPAQTWTPGLWCFSVCTAAVTSHNCSNYIHQFAMVDQLWLWLGRLTPVSHWVISIGKVNLQKNLTHKKKHPGVSERSLKLWEPQYGWPADKACVFTHGKHCISLDYLTVGPVKDSIPSVLEKKPPTWIRSLCRDVTLVYFTCTFDSTIIFYWPDAGTG